MKRERLAMVEQLREGEIHDERVLEAMARVPRHEFVDPVYHDRAYRVHTPLPIDENQTISAPDVVAIMTQALRLKPGDRVLEIGTGSGYQAAILGELVAEVVSVEIRPTLAAQARRRLEKLREEGRLGFRKIEVIVGDGYQGHREGAPYDAIIVTAAPRKIPVELQNQLRVGGRMIIPVGEFYQELQLLEKQDAGDGRVRFTEKIIHTVRFVPMIQEGSENQEERR